MIEYITSIDIWKLLIIALIIIIVIAIIIYGFIKAISIIQKGKTDRVKILVDSISKDNKRNIAKKQLENEYASKNTVSKKLINIINKLIKN